MDAQSLKIVEGNEGNLEDPEQLKILEKLERFHLFRQIPPEKRKEYLSHLFQYCSLTPMVENCEISSKGSPMPGLNLIIEGEVEILRFTREGASYHVSYLSDQQGNSFGEESLVGEEICDSTFLAHTNGRLLTLTQDNFQELCVQFPEIGILILREISHELRERLDKVRSERDLVFNALLEEMNS